MTIRITAGPGLYYGRFPGPSISVGLHDDVLAEMMRLRQHYIDSEQLLSLHSWQYLHPSTTPTATQLAMWNVDGVQKWGKEFPNLAYLITGPTEFWVGHDDDLQAVIDRAPEGSTIHIVNHRPGGVVASGGRGGLTFHGISQEEYDAHQVAP